MRNECIRKEVRGPRLCYKSVKHVWCRRPPTYFTLLLRSYGPRMPSGHNVCAMFAFSIFLIVPGYGLLPVLGTRPSLFLIVLYSGSSAGKHNSLRITRNPLTVHLLRLTECLIMVYFGRSANNIINYLLHGILLLVISCV